MSIVKIRSFNKDATDTSFHYLDSEKCIRVSGNGAGKHCSILCESTERQLTKGADGGMYAVESRRTAPFSFPIDWLEDVKEHIVPGAKFSTIAPDLGFQGNVKIQILEYTESEALALGIELEARSPKVYPDDHELAGVECLSVEGELVFRTTTLTDNPLAADKIVPLTKMGVEKDAPAEEAAETANAVVGG